LTLTLVRELPLLVGTGELKSKCAEVVGASLLWRNRAIEDLRTAEQILLRALGLENW
jgi:hypothetical protein